jgi:hypothetical protein
VLVLFGGLSDLNAAGGRDVFNDTWTFDGTSWREVSSPTAPSAREDPAMATLGGKVVLFGGFDTVNNLSDTWVFDGIWTEVSPPHSPPPRSSGMMVTIGGRIVLYGGAGTVGGITVALGDTWTFDGADWSEVSVTASPPARDDVSGATVGGMGALFGGAIANGPVGGDTWTFDGRTWSQVMASGPSARGSANLGTLGSEVVLFGGFVDNSNGTLASVGDTWTFDGTAWSPVTLSTSPPARSDASIATLDGKVVLFGGDPYPVTDLADDTWTFDGTSWVLVCGPCGPPARRGAALAALP